MISSIQGVVTSIMIYSIQGAMTIKEQIKSEREYQYGDLFDSGSGLKEEAHGSSDHDLFNLRVVYLNAYS